MPKFIERFLYYLSVPRCVCCQEALPFGMDALCEKCTLHFENQKMRGCSICGNRLSKCTCPNDFLDTHYVHKLVKVVRYIKHDRTLPANTLLYSLKKDHREDVLHFMAQEMSDAFRNSAKMDRKYVFINVPRRRGAIVHYGFDHSLLLAKRLARELDGEYLPILKSRAKRQQKDAIGRERLKNASYVLKRSPDLTGKHVVIVDDVVTSGASMASAAMYIKSLGARSVIGLTFAIAYNDPYTPPEKRY